MGMDLFINSIYDDDKPRSWDTGHYRDSVIFGQLNYEWDGMEHWFVGPDADHLEIPVRNMGEIIKVVKAMNLKGYDKEFGVGRSREKFLRFLQRAIKLNEPIRVSI